MAGSGCAWGAEPPRFLEAFGRLWQVQSRLGSGSSASVYRVRCCGTPGSPPGALKQFLPPGTTGAAASAAEYGFRKERAALEQLQGHRNIVEACRAREAAFDIEYLRNPQRVDFDILTFTIALTASEVINPLIEELGDRKRA